MKYLLFLLLTMGTSLFGASQNVVVAVPWSNFLYADIENSLDIAVERVFDKSLIVSASNGEITRSDDKYGIRGAKAGKTEITVSKNRRGKVIVLGTYKLSVRNLPPPIFKVGSGHPRVPKVELTNQLFARADLENTPFDLRFTIKSFSSVVNSDSCATTVHNIGNELSPATKEAFSKIKLGDFVIFKDIIAVGPDGKEVYCRPVFVTVY